MIGSGKHNICALTEGIRERFRSPTPPRELTTESERDFKRTKISAEQRAEKNPCQEADDRKLCR